VINPQVKFSFEILELSILRTNLNYLSNLKWIIDVMSCVVSIKETCIKDGRLLYSDIEKIWPSFDKSLHQWMLKLTEEFDLTFPVEGKEMNIVPCLLPEKAPQYEWPELTAINNKIKEYKVVYTFSYLPMGLFNRIQVRLFQYGDASIIWKNGSLLKKNNHIALITQTRKKSVEIKVNGVKPENIIFLIHEVIETLAQQSFHGIQYDFSFPCPDCVDAQVADPCLFDSTILRRASEVKAPFLQCNKFFHAISIQEMMNTMPIEASSSSLDSNLEHSLRDLKQIQINFKYDVAFWYCEADSVKDSETSLIDPLKVGLYRNFRE
jgi:leucine-rich repeat kinase 2